MEAIFGALVWLTLIGAAVVWVYRNARAERDREAHEQLTAPLAEEIEPGEVFWIPRHAHPTQRYADLMDALREQVPVDVSSLRSESTSPPFGPELYGPGSRWHEEHVGPRGAPERHLACNDGTYELMRVAGRTYLRRAIMRHVVEQQHN